MRLNRDWSSDRIPGVARLSLSLRVAEFSGYCQRALYHEMKLHLTHMDVLAGTGDSLVSKRANPPVAPGDVAHQAKSGRLAGSSLAQGRDVRRARLALCAYT